MICISLQNYLFVRPVLVCVMSMACISYIKIMGYLMQSRPEVGIVDQFRSFSTIVDCCKSIFRTWCVNLWRYGPLCILLTSVGTLIRCRLNLFLLSKNSFNHAVCYTSKFSNFFLTMLYWTPKSICFLPVGYSFINHQLSKLSLYILLHTLLHL